MQKKYLFDLDALQLGDILLSRSNQKISTLIQRYTDGSFSHAMIYVGNAVVHAMPDGVYSENPQRMVFDSPNDFRALRFKANLAEETIEKIANEARFLTGNLYSVREALATKYFGNSDTPSKTRYQFCSRLVAQCYASVGINIVKNPSYCSPNDINKSTSLIAVVNYSREASEYELKLIEGIDPSVLLQKMTFEWLEKTRDLALRFKLKEVFTMNDVTKLLIFNPELDEKVSQFVIDSGYLDYFNVDRNLHPYRYDVDLYHAKVMKTALSLIDEEEKMNHIARKHYSSNIQNAQENYKNYRLKFTRLHIELYRNLLEEERVRSNVIDKVKRRFSQQIHI